MTITVTDYLDVVSAGVLVRADMGGIEKAL